jgi:hypothetical protein
MTQHSALSPDRWASFPLEQQILMIGNEMHRAAKLMAAEDTRSRLLACERVLRLVDPTVEVQPRRTFRRELLRRRDLIAELYVRGEPDPAAHRAALRCLLQMTPVSARQIPFVCG